MNNVRTSGDIYSSLLYEYIIHGPMSKQQAHSQVDLRHNNKSNTLFCNRAGPRVKQLLPRTPLPQSGMCASERSEQKQLTLKNTFGQLGIWPRDLLAKSFFFFFLLTFHNRGELLNYNDINELSTITNQNKICSRLLAFHF